MPQDVLATYVIVCFQEFLDAIRDNKEVKQYVYQSGTLGRLIATGDFEEAFLKLDVGGAGKFTRCQSHYVFVICYLLRDT